MKKLEELRAFTGFAEFLGNVLQAERRLAEEPIVFPPFSLRSKMLVQKSLNSIVAGGKGILSSAAKGCCQRFLQINPVSFVFFHNKINSFFYQH